MDQSVMDELSRVKIVEPGNENKFRKKGSNAIKMTGPTFFQFMYNRKGGILNHRINAYNSVRSKMEKEVEKIEQNPEEADISRYAALEEKLAKIGAKILWAEEKENYVYRQAKKLKVPSLLIRTIAPFRNFFQRKRYKKLYQKQVELAANTVLQDAIKEKNNGFTIPTGEDLTLPTLHGKKSEEKTFSYKKPDSSSKAVEENKPLSLEEVLSQGAKKAENPVSGEMKTEEDIKKHLEFYLRKIGSYSAEEYAKVLENIEKTAKDINFNLSDYIKIHFKDYIKDFVLNVDVKNPSDEDIETFSRYDEVANRYHVDFAKAREEVYKEEEARLLKLKELEEAKVKGQVNPNEQNPVNNEGQTMKYQPFDWSKYQKKDSEEKVEAPVTEEAETTINEEKPVVEEDNHIHNSGNYSTSSEQASTVIEEEAKEDINVDNLYKEYNPDITYDYNYGVMNDDLRNLTEDELKREEKKINEAFLSYVLVKHGKSPRELLSNIQEYIEETNKQRMEHNQELEANGRELAKDRLPLLDKVEEIPQDYYLHSIYSNEFFKENPDQYERTQKLANEVMRRIEEEEKEKQAKIAKRKEQEKIKTGRLVLKYGIGGYYADPNTNLNDQEVLEMVKLLEAQNLYKDAMKRAGMKVREIKEERMKQEQAVLQPQQQSPNFVPYTGSEDYYFVNNQNINKTR